MKQFCKSDVIFDSTRKFLSLKEFIKTAIMKTTKELFLYLIKNFLSFINSEVVTSYV